MSSEEGPVVENGRRLSIVEAFQSLQATEKDRSKGKSPLKKKLKKKNEKKSKTKDGEEGHQAEGEEFEYNWPTCACGMNHPPIPHFMPPDGKRCSYYWQIADAFPYLSLHRTLTCELMFMKTDKDQSGVIELRELRALLKDHLDAKGITDRMIEKTFKEIDTDKSGTLDFFEVLSVVFALIQRDPTNLPYVVQTNFSKVCSIQ